MQRYVATTNSHKHWEAIDKPATTPLFFLSKAIGTRRAHVCIMRHLTIFALTLGVLGSCATDNDPNSENEECVGAKCDGTTTFKGKIKGRKDPIAVFLQKSAVSTKGVLSTDYSQILDGITKQQGCDSTSIHTFVVSDNLLTGTTPQPRIISTACSGDLDRGSQFYMSLVGINDSRTIEMFAWDADARKYNFYDTKSDGKAAMTIDPSPTRCMGCHLTGGDTDTLGMMMTPIMNEMTQPWPHWNAAPGFVSREFNIPPSATQTDTWKKSVLPFLASASEFEQLIREGQRKAVAARVRIKRDAVDLDKAMSLLRPLFCSEQVNYVTEEGGTILNSSVIDPGLRSTYLQIRPDNWQSSWINDISLSFPPVSGKELFQVPVRGNADVAAELSLISSGTLTAQQVLQIRALDWQTPVFSDFRCGLWSSAKTRFVAKKPALTGETIADALPGLLGAVLNLDGTPLLQTNDNIVALSKATPENISALKTALKNGTVGSNCSSAACAVTADALAPTIESYVKSVTRDALLQARDSRICKILALVTPVDKSAFPVGPVERFAAHPSLPKVTCR
jgi:hypothetical protein